MDIVRQTITIDCPAHAVYSFFTDQEQHAEITGADATIDPVAGGQFSAYDGELTGEYTKLVLDQLIVMRWKSAMEEWPPEEYAVLSLEFLQSSDGTTVELIMTDVPEGCAEAVDAGWYDHYWEPLQKEFCW